MKELVEHRIALRAVANQRSDEAPATVLKEPLPTQRDELGSHGKRIQIVMLEAFLHEHERRTRDQMSAQQVNTQQFRQQRRRRLPTNLIENGSIVHEMQH